ncbi:MAG TPA: D-alanyl-D-alanine carboxypeptidase/D-alanyl-D-alanine-endopeptidase [Thermoanaerobaculia bacterium]|nr:D-alanyl-D-alanine carboxypeptidase/D-alanyl-D-alanine-endopeptidase [Thermoanaerobaculia bacterium]
MSRMVFKKRIASLSILLLLHLLFAPGLAPAQTPETALERAVGAEVARALRDTASMGVHIVELDTGETVYGYSPDEPRVIASNSKLFTTAAALDALGPGYFFETRLLMRGSVTGGTLQGDLGVVGSGDPQISGREFGGDPFGAFRPWAAAMRERGIRRVTGDLYLAHGLFEPLRVHPDWPRDQLTEWYEAPVDALSFSDNCILVRVWPGRAGEKARVETVPPVPLFRVDNTATTSAKRKGTRLYVGRLDTLLTVKGSIDAGSGPFETWVTVPDPVLYFGSGLRAALAEEGIVVEGQLRPVPQLPGTIWERVALYRSDLVTAIRTTNKRSQNFYAESLAKTVGAQRCGQGSWAGGVRAIEEFVESIGVPRGRVHMVDGSGMSRANQATPRALTTLLRHMFFHPAAAEFAQSLPYSGEEEMRGWKRRLAAPPYRGNVLAKTGTLNGVSALSGYAKALSGKSYAFSILINKSRGDAHGAQDRIVMALIDNG